MYLALYTFHWILPALYKVRNGIIIPLPKVREIRIFAAETDLQNCTTDGERARVAAEEAARLRREADYQFCRNVLVAPRRVSLGQTAKTLRLKREADVQLYSIHCWQCTLQVEHRLFRGRQDD